MSEPKPARGGCSLALGILLISVGSLLLASNVFGLSLAWLWGRGLHWFGTYWPAILILWGLVKVYQKATRPEFARVGAGEIVLLFLILCAGLTVGLTRRFVDNLPLNVSLDDVIESIGPDISFGPAHSFKEELRFELPAERGLMVENGRGAVVVQGWDETDLKVTVTKRVYRHSEDRARQIAEDIRLRFDVPSSGPARLEVRLPSTDRVEAETDLEIWIPREAPLTVANRHGPLRITGLRSPVGLSTSSAGIEVRDIDGRLNVNGRRGPVRIERVRGDVEARNRYGTLTIKDIEGDLVGETGNGTLVVEQVTGTARLTNRRSRIRATNIGGDLTIEATHTEVFVEDAGSAASIETSYRPVFVNGVGGRLSVEARNSVIEIREVSGNLDVTNVYREVTAVAIGGGATISAQKGGVRLDGISGPIRVASSNNPVEIHGFQSSLIVDSEHAPLTISTDTLGGELNLMTTYGEVRLALPSDSSFRLEAKVKSGQVFSDFLGPDWKEERNEDGVELRGTAGQGAAPITIETSYGDISVVEAVSR